MKTVFSFLSLFFCEVFFSLLVAAVFRKRGMNFILIFVCFALVYLYRYCVVTT